MTQKTTLTDVEPPSKTEKFELLFEMQRTPENAQPVHPEFSLLAEPKLIQPVHFEALDKLHMTVKERVPTAEANGATVTSFKQVWRWTSFVYFVLASLRSFPAPNLARA